MKKYFIILFLVIIKLTSAQQGNILTKGKSFSLLKNYMIDKGLYSTCGSSGNDLKIIYQLLIKVDKNARDEYANQFGNKYYIIETSQISCNPNIQYSGTKLYRAFVQNAFTGSIKIHKWGDSKYLAYAVLVHELNKMQGKYSKDEQKRINEAEAERKSEGQFVFKVNKTTKIDNFVAMDEDLGKLTFNEAQIAIKKLGKEWRLPSIKELKKINNLKVENSTPCCTFHYYMTSDRDYSQSNDSIFYTTYENLQGGIERGNVKKNIFYTNGIIGFKEDRSFVRAVRSLGINETEKKEIEQTLATFIGKTYKISNLEVAQKDFTDVMYWKDAKDACAELGDGCRLPTKDELNILYKNKDKIGGFADFGYWSSTEGDNVSRESDGVIRAWSAWSQNFYYGYQYDGEKRYNHYVRPIRFLGNNETDIQIKLNAENIANQNIDKSVGKVIDSKQNEARIYNYANGEKYEGNLKDGMFSGEGKYTYSSGDYYKGNWRNGQKSGFGIFYYSSGEKYEGNWTDDKENGNGRYYYANGSIYVGNFKDNQFSGVGKITISKKEKFEGLFENDKKNGFGIYNYENGDKYEGNYKDDMFNGEGKYTFSNGEYYKGNWENDEQNGFGVLYYANGDKFEGNWKNDKQNGAGILFYKKGGILKGIWKDGNLISK
jgi:hypothetical protein